MKRRYPDESYCDGAYYALEEIGNRFQDAFEWHDFHLYSFGLFKHGYSARPGVELVASEEDAGINPGAKLMAGVKLSDYVPAYSKWTSQGKPGDSLFGGSPGF